MSAILLGSISTVADTSELQRRAFNAAFKEHNLDWQWDRDDYAASLEKSGGQGRIADFADSRGVVVDAAAIHETKSKIFRKSLATAHLSARPGVADTIRDAKHDGLRVGLVTTTSRDNISALMDALRPEISSADFDVIVDASSVEKPKPDEAAYSFAIESLGVRSEDCVAVEDNVDGLLAAVAAGVTCVAFPNENTSDHDFAAAEARVDRLDLAELKLLIASE